MYRRTVLLRGGGTAIALVAGCSADQDGTTATEKRHTAIVASEADFPSFSGTISVGRDRAFWSFGIDMVDRFTLSYTVESNTADGAGFDVFVFRPPAYDDYVDRVQGGGGSPDPIDEASSEGVTATASKAVQMDPGTYVFVIDTTAVGETGGTEAETTREFVVELRTEEPSSF